MWRAAGSRSATCRAPASTPGRAYRSSERTEACVPGPREQHRSGGPASCARGHADGEIPLPGTSGLRGLCRSAPGLHGGHLCSRCFLSAVTCQPLAELIGDVPCFAVARTDPNLMFTRDAAITLPWAPDVYLSARIAKPLRRPEVAIMSAALERLGLTRVEWGRAGDRRALRNPRPPRIDQQLAP